MSLTKACWTHQCGHLRTLGHHRRRQLWSLSLDTIRGRPATDDAHSDVAAHRETKIVPCARSMAVTQRCSVPAGRVATGPRTSCSSARAVAPARRAASSRRTRLQVVAATTTGTCVVAASALHEEGLCVCACARACHTVQRLWPLGQPVSAATNFWPCHAGSDTPHGLCGVSNAQRVL